MRRRFLNSIRGERIDTSKQYFTIEALEDGLTASLSANACEYRIDDGSWNNLSANTNTPSINKGQTLSFKGSLTPNSGTGKSSRALDPGIGLGIGTFTISKKCNLKGNIMSLFGDNFEGQTDLNGYDYAFYNLFSGCSTIIDSSQLILPATTLVYYCYYNMFRGCSSLVSAPELPATTLAEYCYYNMFRGCTSLVTAPELPATTLAAGCYSSMFENCTSLVSAPALPATTLAAGCYDHMFYGCTKLNYIKALFTTEPGSSYTTYWVSRVSSTGTFVKNKNATWNVTGDDGIPEGWTVEDYNENNLITFYIDNIEYQYEEGMTWEEWINSEYNYNNYRSYENYIAPYEGVFAVLHANHNIIVKGTDYIDAKNTYSFFSSGGNN